MPSTFVSDPGKHFFFYKWSSGETHRCLLNGPSFLASIIFLKRGDAEAFCFHVIFGNLFIEGKINQKQHRPLFNTMCPYLIRRKPEGAHAHVPLNVWPIISISPPGEVKAADLQSHLGFLSCGWGGEIWKHRAT
ncbi:uncharacterized protein TM35_000361130 [Trypanosoma theileri]|uniref:Uncharacterized protein n=1 Tax=Trypanosoma theileri TaxID=67003 RepID=A0A1X0NLD1_9TRYP|nr:uncharacterized protein TM35_000361130 [Trypanosoma theileri]ORC85253.1 hypothetical protein TM35_000361130 [Trypanosoma theileri]